MFRLRSCFIYVSQKEEGLQKVQTHRCITMHLTIIKVFVVADLSPLTRYGRTWLDFFLLLSC